MDTTVYIIIILEELFALWLLYKEVWGRSPFPVQCCMKEKLKIFLARILPCALLLSLAFMLRAAFLDYETTDYTWFLQNWVDFYRQNGGFRALDRSVGNYNIPYLYFMALFSYSGIRDLYLIKLLSIFFDVVLAGACMGIAGECGAGQRAKAVCFFAVLFLPTVIINGAVWAQCDSIYVSLALLGIYFALKERPFCSMIFISLSFGFKLQAIFIMPVFLILWFAKKLKWQHSLIFPVAYLVQILPALFAGRPLKDAVMLYIDQADTVGTAMNYNSPSVFGIAENIADTDKAAAAGIIIAFAAMGIILLVALANRKYLRPRVIVFFSLLTVTAIPFFLPHMHDRYFYAADVLSVTGAVILWQTFPAALCVQFASLICYLAYLRSYYLPLGHIWLTPDKGAWALVIAMVIWCIAASSELTQARKLSGKYRAG